MSNRDPAPLDSQVRILFAKAGGRCSYSGCGVYLVVPGRARGDLDKNVAKVAHITAASPEGPRYDPRLTVSERRSEPNLMLLCGTHHDAVDSQLEFHTEDWLRKAKADHERSVQRGARYAMGQIGYPELEIVCSALAMGVDHGPVPAESIEPPIDIFEKIELNRLSDDSQGLIELGMAQDHEVREFLIAMDRVVPGFATRLTARFKAIYLGGVAEGLASDELFTSIVGVAYENCGVGVNDKLEAAALAVVAHLFSICEIFEHEHSASR